MVRWVFGLAVRASALLVVLLSLVITATSLLHADVMARAWAGVEANADWEPFIAQTPGGVTVALVPAGCFMMGSTDEALEAAFEQCEAGTNGSGYCQRDRYADEQPVHEVCFDQPFWIGHYEVTNAQYAACMAARACRPSARANHENLNDPQQPVVGVSWFMAQAYVAWLSELTGLAWRLPTEAQWEYAARGPDAAVYPWGEETPSRSVLNFHNGYFVHENSAVGSYSPTSDSWVGAADMVGNVLEWTSTIYRAYPYVALDGREDAGNRLSARVLRGGSWDYFQRDARAASRHGYDPNVYERDRGFRVSVPIPCQL